MCLQDRLSGIIKDIARADIVRRFPDFESDPLTLPERVIKIQRLVGLERASIDALSNLKKRTVYQDLGKIWHAWTTKKESLLNPSRQTITCYGSITGFFALLLKKRMEMLQQKIEYENRQFQSMLQETNQHYQNAHAQARTSGRCHQLVLAARTP